MTNEHPIIPSSDLIGQWIVESDMPGQDVCEGTAIRAAQWGADEELEACCKWLGGSGIAGTGFSLRAARRPKPPSLKEQALEALEDANLDAAHYNIILRALEANA